MAHEPEPSVDGGSRPGIEPRRGPGRPRSPEADTAILSAAVAILAAEGYEGLTMEKVAARAGVGKATVYRRWGSKVELAVDAVKGSIADVESYNSGSLEDDLADFIAGIVAWLTDSDTGRMMAGMTAEIQHNAALAEALRTNLVAPRRRVLAARLRHAVEEGQLRGDVDTEVLMDLMVGPVFYRLLITGERIEPSMTESLVRVLLQGAAKPTAPAPAEV